MKTIHFLWSSRWTTPSPSVLPLPHTQLHWIPFTVLSLVLGMWRDTCGVLLSQREALPWCQRAWTPRALPWSEMNLRKAELRATLPRWSLEKPNARKQRGEGRLPGGWGQSGETERCRWRGHRPPVRRRVTSGVWCTVWDCSYCAELCAWKLLGAWVLCQQLPPQRRNTESDSEVIHVSVNLTVGDCFRCVYAYWIILLDTLICSILLVSNTAGKKKIKSVGSPPWWRSGFFVSVWFLNELMNFKNYSQLVS